LITRKTIDSDRELMLVFAFCVFRRQLCEELLTGTPYDESTWKRVGISHQTLDIARRVVEQNMTSFVALNEAVHSCMRSTCPDPPCPDEGSLSMLVAAWSVDYKS